MSNEQSVEDILAEAAKATADKPKKERVKKADGDAPQGEPKAKREPKAPKEPKQWPVWNEDGSQAVNEDGTPMTSTTRMKKPRVKKEGSRSTVDTSLVVKVVGELVAREGSKREARMSHIKTGKTVGEIIDAGGAAKDIVRLQAAGKLELHPAE